MSLKKVCQAVLARARAQILQNSRSWMVMSAWDLHWRNPRIENYRESRKLKVCVSALTGSVPRKWLRGSWGCRRTQVNNCLQLTLTTKPWLCIDLQGKTVSSSSLTLKRWEVGTWNLGQSFEIELWTVGHLHSRWLSTKLLKKSSNLNSNLVL